MPFGSPLANCGTWDLFTIRHNFLKYGRAAVRIQTMKSTFSNPPISHGLFCQFGGFTVPCNVLHYLYSCSLIVSSSRLLSRSLSQSQQSSCCPLHILTPMTSETRHISWRVLNTHLKCRTQIAISWDRRVLELAVTVHVPYDTFCGDRHIDRKGVLWLVLKKECVCKAHQLDQWEEVDSWQPEHT